MGRVHPSSQLLRILVVGAAAFASGAALARAADPAGGGAPSAPSGASPGDAASGPPPGVPTMALPRLAGPPAVDLVLEDTGPFPGGSLVAVEMRVGWDGPPDAWRVGAPRLQTEGGVEASPGEQRSTYDEGRSFMAWSYTLRLPQAAGSYTVGPATVGATAATGDGTPREFRSDPLEVRVAAPMPKVSPGTFRWLAGGAGVLVLGALVGGWRWRRRGSSRSSRLGAASNLAPVLVRARRELDEGRPEAFLACLIRLHDGLTLAGRQPGPDLPPVDVLQARLEQVKFGGGSLDAAEAHRWLEAFQSQVGEGRGRKS